MHIQISENKSLSKIENNGLRPFQNQVYKHRDEKIIVINAMTGAGKSICSQTIALHKLVHKQIKRVIFAVPQKSIGVNFREYPVKAYEHADKYKVSLDLIDSSNTTERLESFIETGKGICICTHSTLTACMPSSKEFDNTLLIIDEAHHVSASEDLMNQLGQCVTNSMESKGHTILMTATPFRSDAAQVVPEGFDYVSSFFSITEFLSSCKHLRGINTEFDLHEKDSYLERINNIDFSRKTAIYIPVTDSHEVKDLFDKHSKENHINELISQIGTRKGIDGNGFYLVERDGKVLRIADLVNDEGSHQEALDNTRKTGECDIVLSMSKAKEGWDYPCIEQVVIVGARGSLSDTLQMIGRGVRDYPGKKTCFVRILAQIADVESEEVREQTSRFLKTVYCAQLLEDIMIPASLFNLKKIPKENGELEDVLPIVKEAIDDPAVSARIGEAIRNLPISIQLGSNNEIKAAVQEIIRNELPELNEQELDQFERAFKTVRFLRSEVIKKDLSLEFAGTINVDDVEFRVIDEMSHINDAVEVFAKAMGLERFNELRSSLTNDFYETLEEASLAAQKLGIVTRKEYSRRYKEDPRLSSHPDSTYLDEWESEGWTYYQYLGQDVVEYYETLEEASQATKKLGIKSFSEYRKGRYKEDPRLVLAPFDKYRTEWISWPHFLGQDVIEKYSTYEEASEAAQKLKIKSSQEYAKRYKEDNRFPSEPQNTYKSKWISWPGFLGKDVIEKYSTYEEASSATQKLGIKSFSEYRKRYKEDPRLSSIPHRTYKSDWVSWPDFLGQEEMDKYKTYKEASQATQKLGIKTLTVYRKRYKEDPKLPSAPQLTYERSWISINHFLGQEEKIEKYKTYKEASSATQKLGIKSREEYLNRYKEDSKLSLNVQRTYKSDWVSWPDFLGLEEKIEKYKTYKEASLAAQKLGIKSHKEYISQYRVNPRLPSNPHRTYKSDWVSWPDFLGQEEMDKYKTYKEASQATQKLGIKSREEYMSLFKKNPRLPSNPNNFYRSDWVTWDHFLRRKGKYSTYQEASQAAQKLEITTYSDYRNSYKNDRHLPSDPKNKYKSEWISWDHFLGKDKPLEAEEGKESIALREHKKKERNATIVKKLKEKMLDELGKLACQDCGHSFEESGFDYVEAHHDSKQHSELSKEGEIVQEEDFKLLCANCHVIAHRLIN